MKDKFIINLGTLKRVNDFVHDMSDFKSDIDIIRGRYIIDGKSYLGLLSLDLFIPLDVKINTNDIDELTLFNEVIQKYLN